MSANAIDFLHPRRVPVLGLTLLVLGACALVAAIGIDGRWRSERLAREAAERARAEAARSEREAAVRPVVPTAGELRLRQIAPRLRQPWLPTLRLIEKVTEPPVYLLALSVNPSTGEVDLEGEVPGFAQALEYMRSLDEEGVLGPARMRAHGTATDPSGRAVTRFSIVTRWVR